MANESLTSLTAATAATGGTLYGVQSGNSRKFTLTAAGAAVAEAANAGAQQTALGLSIGSDVQAYDAKLVTSSSVNWPIVVSIKNVALRTSGAPADIATIAIPAWVTRWCVQAGTNSGNVRCIAESASGTLAAGVLSFYTGASATGTNITANITPPASAGAATVATGASNASVPFVTASQIYVYQIANSANAGSVSIYVLIEPLL